MYHFHSIVTISCYPRAGEAQLHISKAKLFFDSFSLGNMEKQEKIRTGPTPTIIACSLHLSLFFLLLLAPRGAGTLYHEWLWGGKASGTCMHGYYLWMDRLGNCGVALLSSMGSCTIGTLYTPCMYAWRGYASICYEEIEVCNQSWSLFNNCSLDCDIWFCDLFNASKEFFLSRNSWIISPPLEQVVSFLKWGR